MTSLLRSVSLFSRITSQPGDGQNFRKQPKHAITEKNTPVYEVDSSRQVAILEIDYPEVAGSFSKAFPGADNQLWLKEDNSLFVYFSITGNKVKAVFNVKGRMNYSVSIIGLFEVPSDTRIKIQNEYSSFSFFSARQIQAGAYMAYELVLENDYEYIDLSTTDNDEIVVTGRTRKTIGNKGQSLLPSYFHFRENKNNKMKSQAKCGN